MSERRRRQPVSVRALLLAAAALALIGSVRADRPLAPADDRLKQWMQPAWARWTAHQATPSSASEQAARMHERADLLQRGESALANANVEAAQQAFDRAALIQHAADSEMGLIRTYMQGGEYRRALAFGAHTAGAHRDAAGGAALYAWLLRIGGQADAARRALSDAETRMPADPLVIAVRDQLSAAQPLAEGRLLVAPARLAPYGSSSGLPPTAHVAGTGMLIDGGRRVLVPINTLSRSTSVWVRNGLGHLAHATVERRLTTLGVAILRLATELPGDTDEAFAPNDPFPGSIAFAVEYATSRHATPSWPVLSSGFLGQPAANGARRQLGIDLPAGPRGGPVFDAGGRVVGIAVPVSGNAGQLVPASQLRASVGELLGRPSPQPANSRVPIDRIYESALRTSLQIIVQR